MRRVWVLVVSASLVTVLGCGRYSYEQRLEKTLAKLEYDRKVMKNLMPAADAARFKELSIWVRAPKEEALAKTGQLAVGEGQFDLDASFNDKTDAALHVLARVKMPKKAPTKGAAPPPPPPQRGEFIRDVLGVLANSGISGPPEVFENPKLQEESKGKGSRTLRFRRLIFPANDKEVKLYLYKEGTHEVALIFVYDAKLKGILTNKIDLSLENFAAGATATRNFNGGADEEIDSGAGTPQGPV